MSGLQDARVDAMARVMADLDTDENWPTDKDYGVAAVTKSEYKVRDEWRNEARAALAAADAVVTVEMIARAIDPDSWRLRDAPQYAHLPDEAKEGVVRKSVEQAGCVLALLRGGGERCRDCSRPVPAHTTHCRNCCAKREVGG